MKLTDDERDNLYNAAVPVWNRWVATQKLLCNKEADALFEKYIKNIWRAAKRLNKLKK